jgi:uncharacterized protein YndB with AHSA1/START domain
VALPALIAGGDARPRGDRQAAVTMIDFTIERDISAPIETVFAKLTDHRGYASLTLLRKSELEREGTLAPNGVGAVRKLSLLGPPMREEITTYEQPKHFAYTLLSGLPVRNHVGDVRLEQTGAGTHVTYRVTSHPTIKGAGPVIEAVLKQAIGQLLSGVAKSAEAAR